MLWLIICLLSVSPLLHITGNCILKPSYDIEFEVFKNLLRPEVDINARCEVEGINMNRGPQQTLNTENSGLNVITTHSKFISSPFISLFSTIIPIFSPSVLLLYRDNTGKSAFEIHVNTCRSRLSVSESRVLKSRGKSVFFFLLFYTINWRIECHLICLDR